MSECEYCGESHNLTALCSPRLKVSRRSFLLLTGAAAVGLACASLGLPVPDPKPEMPAWMTEAFFTGGGPYREDTIVCSKSTRELYESLLGADKRYLRTDATSPRWADVTRSAKAPKWRR